MSIESKSGKSSKKGTKAGKPKNSDKDEINKRKLAALKRMNRGDLEFLITNIFYDEILKSNKCNNLE